MAGSTRTVTIRIVGGGGNGASNGGTSGNGFDDGGKKALDAKKILDNASKSEGSNGHFRDVLSILKVATSQASSILSSSLNYAKGRYFSMKEDYLSENAYNQISGQISYGVSLGKSIYSGGKTGFALGSAFGPIGGAVGAVIGAVGGGVTYGVNREIQYQQKMSGYYQQLNATNAQTQFQAQRLGLSDEGQNTLN